METINKPAANSSVLQDDSVNKKTTITQFLKAFFSEPDELIFLRAFEPTNAPKKFDSEDKEISTARKYAKYLVELPNLKEELKKLNKTHGIYFVVNSGGNSDNEITRFNAVFVENDNLPIAQQNKNLNDAPILPSIRVETKKSIHAYWLIDGECSKENWSEIQSRLIWHFNGDPKIKNPSRLMRLPNFNHVSYDEVTKTHSYKRVDIIDFQPERRYTVKQLMEAFPAVPQPEVKLEKATANFESSEMPEWYNELQETIMSGDVKKVPDGYSFKCPVCGISPEGSAILFNDGGIHCRKSGCKPRDIARAFGIDVDTCKRNYKAQCTQKQNTKFNSNGDDFMKVEEDNTDSFSSSNSLISEIKGLPHENTNRALYGLAGEVVKTIEPHTEADLMALLLNMIVAFGNVIGRKAFFEADGSQHYTNLFGVLVGTTSAGKGTSWAQIKRLFAAVDCDWSANRLKTGLSSGEGLISAVSDENNVSDKRLMIVESEFSTALSMKHRDGNTLSQMIRGFWDEGKAGILNKNTPLTANNAHISILGHITPDELRVSLDHTQIANGFANRFLWVNVKRSKLLPNGGKVADDEQNKLVMKLKDAVEFAQTVGEMKRDEEAERLWIRNYPVLTAERSGAFGNATTRARAQVVRLSMIYALMNKSDLIKREHLEAALAFWQHCENSAKEIFGDATGNKELDKLVYSLKIAPEQKLSRTEISRDVFGGNKSAGELNAIFALAEQRSLAKQFTEGEGKETTDYLQLTHTNYEFDEVDEPKTFTASN